MVRFQEPDYEEIERYRDLQEPEDESHDESAEEQYERYLEDLEAEAEYARYAREETPFKALSGP